LRALLLAVLTLVPAFSAQQGAQTPPRKPAVNDIFSGTVTELAADSITVVRKLPARDAVTRKFLLSPQTTIEGKLHEKARVTVRYQPADEGQYRAVHIIVR
jgi:hypothetical protein